MARIIAAGEIICDVCKAQPGEQCTYWYGSGRRRERKFRFGAHSKRVRDAQAATETLNTLVNS